MGARCSKPYGSLFILRDHLYDRMLQVREREQELTHESFHACRLVEDLSRCLHSSLIQQLLVDAAHQSLILIDSIRHHPHSFVSKNGIPNIGRSTHVDLNTSSAWRCDARRWKAAVLN